jgi:hypothetical protein
MGFWKRKLRVRQWMNEANLMNVGQKYFSDVKKSDFQLYSLLGKQFP